MIKAYKTKECYAEPLDAVGSLVKGKTLMTSDEHAFILELIKEYRPKKILEIGTNVGGTTAVLLSAVHKLALGAKLFSVDLDSTYEQIMQDTVYSAMNAAYQHNWDSDSWIIKCGHTIAGVAEGIGGGIDFCVIDAAHILPGELLDFIAVLPFLSDGAIVVLHDIRIATSGAEKAWVATNVLFSAVVAEEKCTAHNDAGHTINIGAFKVGADTRKYIENVMCALALPWEFLPYEQCLNEYNNIVMKYYQGQYDFYKRSMDEGQYFGTLAIQYYDYDKMYSILTADNKDGNCTEIDRKIVMWGCGYGATAIKRDLAAFAWVPILKNGMPNIHPQLLEKITTLKHSIIFVDTSIENRDCASNEIPHNAVYNPNYLEGIKDEIACVVITPITEAYEFEIRNSLDEMGIPSEKVYHLRDFELEQPTSLNYLARAY